MASDAGYTFVHRAHVFVIAVNVFGPLADALVAFVSGSAWIAVIASVFVDDVKAAGVDIAGIIGANIAIVTILHSQIGALTAATVVASRTGIPIIAWPGDRQVLALAIFRAHVAGTNIVVVTVQ